LVARPTQLGERYRGEAGPIGYLLRQTVHAFNTAMESRLRDYGLTSPQFGALFVLDREPGLSAADVARAMGTTPQAANVLVAGMEREGLVYRAPHPTHGRILEVYTTEEGLRRFKAARPFIRRLETTMCEGLDGTELAIVKRWLVESARALSNAPARSADKPTDMRTQGADADSTRGVAPRSKWSQDRR
jgi:DNA-binding MarR family transcriptional regulator